MTDPIDDELAPDPEDVDEDTVPDSDPESDGEPNDSRVPGVTTP